MKSAFCICISIRLDCRHIFTVVCVVGDVAGTGALGVLEVAGALALGPDACTQTGVKLQVAILLTDLVPRVFAIPTLGTCKEKKNRNKRIY